MPAEDNTPNETVTFRISKNILKQIKKDGNLTEGELLDLILAEKRNRVHAEIRYKQLYEGSPDMLRTIDTNGIILECNEAYAKTLGFSKHEVIGRSIFDHVSEKSIDALKQSFESWKKNGIVANNEVWLKRKDGSVFPALISATNLYDKDGGLIGSNTIIRDITKIYEPQKTIQERDLLIQQQLKQLQKIKKGKDEFITTIVHELKTPLVPVKTYLEMFSIEKFGPLTDDQKQKMDIINPP